MIDYCLEDVRLTYELIMMAKHNGELNDPRNRRRTLPIKRIEV